MGSADAFLELIRTHGDKAYNFAYRLAGNEADAKDLVQEALMRAFEHHAAYDPGKPFDSWLCRILQNIYLDGVRKLAHRQTVSLDAAAPMEDTSWEELLPAPGDDPAQEAARAERDALLQRALDALPIHYRTAVSLSDIEGMTYDQIGRIMACPVGTVRSRIHQGRILLRRAFERLQEPGGSDEHA